MALSLSFLPHDGWGAKGMCWTQHHMEKLVPSELMSFHLSPILSFTAP